MSSRTTSRSTTVSESVMSALSSARPGDEMIQEEEETTVLAILDGDNHGDSRPHSKQSSQRGACTPDRENRAQSQQSSHGSDSSRVRRQDSRSQQRVLTPDKDQDILGQSLNDSHSSRSRRESNSRASSQNLSRAREHDNRPKSRT